MLNYPPNVLDYVKNALTVLRRARGRAALFGMLLVGSPAMADAPRAIAPDTVCSLDRRFCASRLADAGFVAIWHQADRSRRPIWQTRVLSPNFAVGDDGRTLVEIQPGINLVDRNATADTIVLIFHRPGLTAVPLRLRDLAIDPRRLPATVSHRVWARTLGFDGRGGFRIDTADGRDLRFDPATGWRRQRLGGVALLGRQALDRRGSRAGLAAAGDRRRSSQRGRTSG